MLWRTMKERASSAKPAAYVFEEDGNIVIKGRGPLGARLALALSCGWNAMHSRESATAQDARWSIHLGEQRSQKVTTQGLVARRAGVATALLGCWVGYAAGAGQYGWAFIGCVSACVMYWVSRATGHFGGVHARGSR